MNARTPSSGLVALCIGATLLTGCSLVREKSPFFSVPREQVIELSTKKIDWLKDLPSPEGSSRPLSLEDAVASRLERYGAHTPPGGDYRCISQFLCLSDAQIRDEQVYAQGKSDYIDQLLYFDRFFGVTIRRSFVEKFDSLTFASFLIGYRKEVEATGQERAKLGLPDPFILHAGDLLDISTSTELLTALSTVRACLPEHRPPRFYSVAGNHDGLVFGNLPNEWVDMRSLGINLSEFVLAHLLVDPEATPAVAGGFGFGGNELIRRFGSHSSGLEYPRTDQLPEAKRATLKLGIRGMTASDGGVAMLLGPQTVDSVPTYPIGWRGRAARQARRLITAGRARAIGARGNAYVPMVFSDRIEVPDGVDGGELQLGYYHWDQQLATAVEGLEGVRYIVLDTRNKDFSANGQIGLIQLGWLYNRLADALARRYCVVIFAHHSPGMMEKDRWTGSVFDKATTGILCRMLERFPNVIALFHGHYHWNEALRWPDENGRIALIQTGSLADFPQVGRKVWIYAKALGDDCYQAAISWEFVRPRGNFTSQGEILDSLLSTSQRESLKEFNSGQSTLEARWHRAKEGWGLWGKVPGLWQKVNTGWEDWRRRHLDYGEIRVGFRLTDTSAHSRSSWLPWRSAESSSIRAKDVFGAKLRLKWANEMREYVGCRGVVESPRRIERTVRPPLGSPSGVAVLKSSSGERIVFVADDDTDDALYRAALPPTATTEALDLDWREVALPSTKLDDIEALAQWSNRQVFAICSQSRTRRTGASKPSRSRLALITFDDNLSKVAGPPEVCDGLRDALIADLEKQLGRHLHDVDVLSKLRPSGGGINVEALAKWDGMLLLGLRDPVTKDDDLIVVPLMNPVAAARREAPPQFGPALVLRTNATGCSPRVVRWVPPSRNQLVAHMHAGPHFFFVLEICRDAQKVKT